MKLRASGILVMSILGLRLLSAQSQDPPHATGAFVQVDGSKLYYEECGSGPTAIVLLHDGVVDSAVWNDVWGTLCKDFHTIRYDRRGYGRSLETTKPYYEADDLADLLRDRGIRQAALVGGSHGGNVALYFALRYPAQVSQLVLVGPGLEGFPYSEHFLLAQVAFQNTKDSVKAHVESNYLIAPTNAAAREHLRTLLEAAPQDMRHKDMPLPEKPVLPYVQNLRVPTLILIGSADIADNQAVAGALQMAIPGAARIVVPDTGHLMYLEKPDAFFSLVREFLKSHGF
jgi:pimeloyl-ACP methyl ester carboxylesterase